MALLRDLFGARPYHCERWTDTWGARRWAVVGPAGAAELYDMTRLEPSLGALPAGEFEHRVVRDAGLLGGPQAARTTGLFVMHLHTPDAAVIDFPPDRFAPNGPCRYAPGDCRAAHDTLADSAIGASALELAHEQATGPLWLLLATTYGVYFADRRVVRAVLREAAT